MLRIFILYWSILWSLKTIDFVIITVGTVPCPVLWDLRTQDMSSKSPKILNFWWKSFFVVLYIFNVHTCFVKVWIVQKHNKRWKIQYFLDHGWFTGGYMHKGSIKLVFKSVLVVWWNLAMSRTCSGHSQLRHLLEKHWE